MFDWSKMPPVSLPFEMPNLIEMPGMKTNENTDEAEEESESLGALPILFMLPYCQMLVAARLFNAIVPNLRGEKEDSVKEQNDFSPLGFPLPPALLKALLQLDASPKTLEQIQRVLDFVWDN